VYKLCIRVYSIGVRQAWHPTATHLMKTIQDQISFTKELIFESETAYQFFFASGELDQMIAAKRELSKQRKIFGKLLKQQMCG